MRIVGSDYHPDLVEIGVFQEMVGQDEMSDMNRIKGSEKKANPGRHFS